MIFLISLKI